MPEYSEDDTKVVRRRGVLAAFAALGVYAFANKPQGELLGGFQGKFQRELTGHVWENVQPLSYSAFLKDLQDEKIKTAEVKGASVLIKRHDDSFGQVQLQGPDHALSLIGEKVIDPQKVEVSFDKQTMFDLLPPLRDKIDINAITGTLLRYGEVVALIGATPFALNEYAHQKQQKKLRDLGERIHPDNHEKTAYHEAGHALAGVLSPGLYNLGRASIKFKEDSFGRVTFKDSGKLKGEARGSIFNEIVICMAGRAAEIVKFGDYTTLSRVDLTESYDLATKMVEHLGMSEDIGHVINPDALRSPNTSRLSRAVRGIFGDHSKPIYTEAKQEKIDAARDKLLKEAMDTAIALLTENRQSLENIAQALLKKQELTADEIRALIVDRSAPQTSLSQS